MCVLSISILCPACKVSGSYTGIYARAVLLLWNEGKLLAKIRGQIGWLWNLAGLPIEDSSGKRRAKDLEKQGKGKHKAKRRRKSNLFKCHKVRIYKANLATTGFAQIPFWDLVINSIFCDYFIDMMSLFHCVSLITNDTVAREQSYNVVMLWVDNATVMGEGLSSQ